MRRKMIVFFIEKTFFYNEKYGTTGDEYLCTGVKYRAKQYPSGHPAVRMVGICLAKSRLRKVQIRVVSSA